MTDSMIERVARAICAIEHDEFNQFPDLSYDEKRQFRDIARAAIEAMLAPSTDMISAGLSSWEESNTAVLSIYRAMISKALEGGE